MVVGELFVSRLWRPRGYDIGGGRRPEGICSYDIYIRETRPDVLEVQSYRKQEELHGER